MDDDDQECGHGGARVPTQSFGLELSHSDDEE